MRPAGGVVPGAADGAAVVICTEGAIGAKRLPSAREFLRIARRFDPANSGDREGLPIHRGGFVARMKVAHIAEQAGERDDVGETL